MWVEHFIWGRHNCSSPAVILGGVSASRTILLTVCWDKIDTCPLTGWFITLPDDWNVLIIVLIVEMGIFGVRAIFLATSHFVTLNNGLLHITAMFFGLTHCDKWLRELDLCVTSYLYPMWNRRPWFNNFKAHKRITVYSVNPKMIQTPDIFLDNCLLVGAGHYSSFM